MRLSFEFALQVIAYCDELNRLRKFEMSHQLFKSGTSIHAQIREAQHPESVPDFIHKLKIGMKEAAETEGWLLLCQHSEDYPSVTHLVELLPPIQKMLASSIATSRRKNGMFNRVFWPPAALLLSLKLTG
ncbi:MAG: four helix bundle protein [Chitinophagaceae bacterium]|nr:MAG: four helix bundle protein [Chitinophagaceae bacterium]